MKHLSTEVPVARYTQRPFPAYRFLPGKTPHPTRDKEGHSHGVEEVVLDTFSIQHWFECEMYLYGVDLFNNKYWWEAHEAWEVVWKFVGRSSQTGLFLQGLIQIAAAMLKTEQGLQRPAQRLARDGVAKLALAHGVYLGVEIVTFATVCTSYAAGKLVSPPSIRLVVPATLTRSQ